MSGNNSVEMRAYSSLPHSSPENPVPPSTSDTVNLGGSVFAVESKQQVCTSHNKTVATFSSHSEQTSITPHKSPSVQGTVSKFNAVIVLGRQFMGLFTSKSAGPETEEIEEFVVLSATPTPSVQPPETATFSDQVTTAIRTGNTEALASLQLSIPTGEESFSLSTLLKLAISHRQLGVLKWLLQQGSDLSLKNDIQVLIDACDSNQAEIAHVIISSMLKMSSESTEGAYLVKKILEYSKNNDNPKLIETLFSAYPEILAGASPECISELILDAFSSRPSNTVEQAAELKCYPQAHAILSTISDPSQNDLSLLRQASRRLVPGALDALLSYCKKENLFKCDDFGYAPMHYAVMIDTERVNILIKHGASFYQPLSTRGRSKGLSPVHLAARVNPTVLAFFISQDVDVTKTDSMGRTPLFHACCIPRLESIKLLVNHLETDEVQRKDNLGRNIFHAALEMPTQSSLFTVRFLLGHPKTNILLRVADNTGKTPLSIVQANSDFTSSVIFQDIQEYEDEDEREH